MGAGQIAGISFYVLAFFVNIVAIATPVWMFNNARLTHSGLSTVVSDNETVLLNREAAENGALAFSIIGDILLISAIVVTGNAYRKEESGMKGRKGGAIGLVAALFIMIGMSIYTGIRITDVDFQFIFWGYSFVLGWVSFCHALIGGISVTMTGAYPKVGSDNYKTAVEYKNLGQDMQGQELEVVNLQAVSTPSATPKTNH